MGTIDDLVQKYPCHDDEIICFIHADELREFLADQVKTCRGLHGKNCPKCDLILELMPSVKEKLDHDRKD